MAKKTVNKDYYTYDELSDEAKAHAREWYANHISGDMAYIQTEENLHALKKTIETAGLELTDYHIGNDQYDHVTIWPDAYELNELLRWTEYYGWYEPYPACVCPRMEAKENFVGNCAANVWNETCAPALDKVLAEAEGMCGDELDNLDVEKKIMEQLAVLEGEVLRELQRDREWCYEDEYIVSGIEANEMWFDEDGNPE